MAHAGAIPRPIARDVGMAAGSAGTRVAACGGIDRAGHPPEADLSLAVQKDAGIDPAVLAWLLGQFPTHPLPLMLEPLTEDELRQFRDALRERFRRIAIP